MISDQTIKIRTIYERFPRVPILAVTATATENIKIDCIRILRLRRPEMFRSSTNRPNLFYEVRPKLKGV
eukprot:UN19978